MSDKVKERIAKEAEEYLRNVYGYNDIDLMPPSDTEKMVDCYIAGATAERTKAWNEAIDAVVARLESEYVERGDIVAPWGNIKNDIERIKINTNKPDLLDKLYP